MALVTTIEMKFALVCTHSCMPPKHSSTQLLHRKGDIISITFRFWLHFLWLIYVHLVIDMSKKFHGFPSLRPYQDNHRPANRDIFSQISNMDFQFRVYTVYYTGQCGIILQFFLSFLLLKVVILYQVKTNKIFFFQIIEKKYPCTPTPPLMRFCFMLISLSRLSKDSISDHLTFNMKQKFLH